MIDLGAWLQERGKMRREISVQDCCTMPCDWLVANGWPDPMEGWRGLYDEESVAIEEGGLLAIAEPLFARAGVPMRAGDPVIGDVALVRIVDLEAGAIYAGKRWAFVGERGVGMASLDPECIVMVWAAGHG